METSSWGKSEGIKLLTIKEEVFFSFKKIIDKIKINTRISVPKFTNIYGTWTLIVNVKRNFILKYSVSEIISFSAI